MVATPSSSVERRSTTTDQQTEGTPITQAGDGSTLTSQVPDQNVIFIPSNSEVMGGLIGMIHGPDIIPNQPLNENRSSRMGNLGVNGEDLSLNVNKNGNFFDSTFTTVVDSNRRKADNGLGGIVAPEEKYYNDVMDVMEQDIVGAPKNGFWLFCVKVRFEILNGVDSVSIQQHQEGNANLSEVLAQREIFWKQRSKQFWLNSGDKNSKYFHSVASSRKRNNNISQLQDNNGRWLNWDSGLEHVITRYFQNLFQTSNIDLGTILNKVRPSVSREQNDDLLLAILEDKVRSALFQMHPNKSPGPDGMTPAFYQKHWSIVGTDVVQFVHDFFDTAKKNGFYSARSAYKLLQDQKHHSDNPEGHTFWKKLWSLKVPPKTKDLVWRAASNCLATKFAWSCWEFSGFAAAGREPLSLLIWLEESARCVDNETLCKIVMLCRALWGNIPLLSPLKEGDGSERWIKPDTCIKLNIDATTFDRDFKHGYGCVVRNTNGELVSVFSGFKHGNVSPELAEIMGIREALSWLNCHNYTRAAIETDNLVCVEAIWSAESFASGFDLVVEKCKNILRNLLNVSLFFVKRSANYVVHFIARHSISLAERMFLINSVPLDLMSILMSDCYFYSKKKKNENFHINYYSWRSIKFKRIITDHHYN
uniref:RNase H type-1 domain-containing protein n=1 Tax=Cannabis sativa TaxID=3483 RepID=A0A803PPX6_CANSA